MGARIKKKKKKTKEVDVKMKGFCAGQDTSRLLRYIQALRSDPGNSLKKPGVQVQGQQVHGCHYHLKRGRRSAAGLGSRAHLTYSPST